jgi:hypothetical protein
MRSHTYLLYLPIDSRVNSRILQVESAGTSARAELDETPKSIIYSTSLLWSSVDRLSQSLEKHVLKQVSNCNSSLYCLASLEFLLAVLTAVNITPLV